MTGVVWILGYVVEQEQISDDIRTGGGGGEEEEVIGDSGLQQSRCIQPPIHNSWLLYAQRRCHLAGGGCVSMAMPVYDGCR